MIISHAKLKMNFWILKISSKSLNSQSKFNTFHSKRRKNHSKVMQTGNSHEMHNIVKLFILSICSSSSSNDYTYFPSRNAIETRLCSLMVFNFAVKNGFSSSSMSDSLIKWIIYDFYCVCAELNEIYVKLPWIRVNLQQITGGFPVLSKSPHQISDFIR